MPAKSPEINRATFKRYYYNRRLTIVDKNFACLCGNRAVQIRHNSPVCQRCLNIESRLELDFHRDSCGVTTWQERQKIRRNRERISPLDPALFGHSI